MQEIHSQNGLFTQKDTLLATFLGRYALILDEPVDLACQSVDDVADVLLRKLHPRPAHRLLQRLAVVRVAVSDCVLEARPAAFDGVEDGGTRGKQVLADVLLDVS